MIALLLSFLAFTMPTHSAVELIAQKTDAQVVQQRYIPNASPEYRWGWDGHKMVCSIAWWEMKTETRKAISTFLDADVTYERFMESCLWADDVRGKDPQYDRWSTAHYVNLPRGATAFDLARDCGETFCVVEGIEESLQGLKDTSKSKTERLISLKFLSHFVGDVHQPMHAGYGDDRGGNDTKITLFGKPANMHGMWDYGLLDHTGKPWVDYASVLYFQITDENRRDWVNLNPVTWVEESFAIISLSAYDTAGSEVGQAYYDAHIRTLETRIKQAGVRLAQLLDQVLAE